MIEYKAISHAELQYDVWSMKKNLVAENYFIEKLA